MASQCRKHRESQGCQPPRVEANTVWVGRQAGRQAGRQGQSISAVRCRRSDSQAEARTDTRAGELTVQWQKKDCGGRSTALGA